MNNFRRDIYKLTKSPKPPKPGPQISWYRSEGYLRDTTDFCIPINIQVFKQPNTLPIQIGDILYTDFQETSTLSGGVNSSYNISNLPIQNPNGVSDLTSIQINDFGVVTNVVEGDCNTALNLVEVFITNFFNNRGDACTDQARNIVKVNSLDINQDGSIKNFTQLYTQNSLNSNPVIFDPTTSINFDVSANNFIGLPLPYTQPSGTLPSYTMQILPNGVISNVVYC